MPTAAPWKLSVAAAFAVLAASCGQKGPPLAPLHLVPGPVTEASVRRIADRARLQFVLPTRNANGPGRLELDRVEIYAMTVSPGVTPPNRELLTKTYLVGAVEVRPAPVEGEPPVEGDKRPGPGETVTFEDELTPEKLTPVILKVTEPVKPGAATPEQPAGSGRGAAADATGAKPPTPIPGQVPTPVPQAPAAGAVPAAAPVSKEPSRIYVARGMTRSGRPGPPSSRLELPVGVVPPPPQNVAAKVTESGILLEWSPNDQAPSASFNVYRADEPTKQLNPAPVKEAKFEHTDVKLGEPQCYRVRSVVLAAKVALEGDLSEPACATPTDVFPPAAPKGLAAVPTAGQITLIWDANTEKDLAGYLVLRGDAPDGPLQAITAAPIKDTSYRDTTVKPGTRYVYAIVAVDTATPANTSAQSPRVEETAR
jgi:hypothetical protein